MNKSGKDDEEANQRRDSQETGWGEILNLLTVGLQDGCF